MNDDKENEEKYILGPKETPIQQKHHNEAPVPSGGFLTNNLIDLDDKSIPGEVSPDKGSINGITVSEFKI